MLTTWLTVSLACAGQVGSPASMEYPNYPAPAQAFSQHGFEGQYEQRFPFDTQQNWVHGYYQDIPAYRGYAHFRPYNYKDLLSQSQVSAGWGNPAQMPYSQQFWHRYQDQATMLKLPVVPPVDRSSGWQTIPGTVPPAPHANYEPLNYDPAAAGVPVSAYAAPQYYVLPPQYMTGVPYAPYAQPVLPQAPVQGTMPLGAPQGQVAPAGFALPAGTPLLNGPAIQQ